MSARTPADLLADLEQSDATRPRLTWYDDTTSPPERIELSARVIRTWAAKAANLLVDELDVERGNVLALDLPAHWRATYWALGAWSLGAALQLETTTEWQGLVVSDLTDRRGGDLVLVPLPALAREWPGERPAGTRDGAAELMGQPDVFDPFDPPGPDDAALLGPGTADAPPSLSLGEFVQRARELAADCGWTTRARIAVPLGLERGPAQQRWLLDVMLAVWSVDGSLVVCRDSAPEAAAARWSAERVTSVAAPAGRPASRS